MSLGHFFCARQQLCKEWWGCVKISQTQLEDYPTRKICNNLCVVINSAVTHYIEQESITNNQHITLI